MINRVDQDNKHQHVGKLVLVTLREHPHNVLVGHLISSGREAMIRMTIVGIEDEFFPVYPGEAILLEVD